MRRKNEEMKKDFTAIDISDSETKVSRYIETLRKEFSICASVGKG